MHAPCRTTPADQGRRTKREAQPFTTSRDAHRRQRCAGGEVGNLCRRRIRRRRQIRRIAARRFGAAM
jgi:hypothetical protein